MNDQVKDQNQKPASNTAGQGDAAKAAQAKASEQEAKAAAEKKAAEDAAKAKEKAEQEAAAKAKAEAEAKASEQEAAISSGGAVVRSRLNHSFTLADGTVVPPMVGDKRGATTVKDGAACKNHPVVKQLVKVGVFEVEMQSSDEG